jgi:hypothetical protein
MNFVKPASTLVLICLPAVLALCSCGSLPGAREITNAPANQTNVVPASSSDTLKITIGNLLARKEDYKGRRVEVTGYYASWFEGSILSETKTNSGDVTLWVDRFRLKPGHADAIKWVESGFVRVIGTFDYREGYGSGHLGMCPAGITQVELFEALR